MLLALLIVPVFLAISSEGVCRNKEKTIETTTSTTNSPKLSITKNTNHSTIRVNIFRNKAVNFSVDSVVSSLIKRINVSVAHSCVSKCASYPSCLSCMFENELEDITNNCFLFNKYINTSTEIIQSNYSTLYLMNYNIRQANENITTQINQGTVITFKRGTS